MRGVLINPLLLLMLLAACAAPSFAARPTSAAHLGLNVCEQYGAEECKEHNCTLCHSTFGKFDVCFEPAVARKMPAKLFECEFPAPPQPAAVDAACGQQADEASCASSPGCVWCLSAAVPSACYSESEAKRLPAGAFQCKFPQLA